MKSTMIASVREKTGYDNSFFCNNDPESMNNRIKTRMEKKLSWPECIQQLNEMTEEEEKTIKQALIDEGPYRICPECCQLMIPVEKWLAMSKDLEKGEKS